MPYFLRDNKGYVEEARESARAAASYASAKIEPASYAPA
jgi:hypothetical protein